MERERDYAVDIIKFLAAIIITWSHFELPLGKYAIFATGGAFGDTLFFFISGYTLFLSNKGNGFFNWYKRRINRIYPTVFAWALLSSIIFNIHNNMLEVIMKGGGFFVSCIMVFYLLFYPIKKHFKNNLASVIFVCFALQCLAYFLIDHNDFNADYIWQWSSYFIAMLMGAMVGQKNYQQKSDGVKTNNVALSIIGALSSIIIYYTIMYFESLQHFMLAFRIIPLMGFVISLFELCNTDFCRAIYFKPWSHILIMTIGSMCLEIYIVQPVLLTDKMNSLFPLNLLLMFVIILGAAYILKVTSKLWSQTFSDKDYNWKSMLKVY